MNSEQNRPRNIEQTILARVNEPVLEKMAARPVEYRAENAAVMFEVLETQQFKGEESLRYSNKEVFIRSYRSASIDRLIQVPSRIKGKGIPKVEFVRFTPLPNLEKAIRFSNHIAEKYEPKTGEESMSLTQIIKLMQRLTVSFKDPDVTEEQFEKLTQDAAKEIVEAGYDKAHLNWKQKASERIIKSLQKDRLNRRNRSGSRLSIAHLYPITTEARIVNKRTRNKYRRICDKLIEQRDIHLSKFETCIDQIETLSQLKDIEFANSRDNLVRFVFHNLDKDTIIFPPYSGIAAKARFLLLGNPDKIDVLKKYIGNDADKFAKRKVFKSMDVSHQKARLTEIKRMLEESLLQGEQRIVEGSDDWVWQDMDESK